MGKWENGDLGRWKNVMGIGNIREKIRGKIWEKIRGKIWEKIRGKIWEKIRGKMKKFEEKFAENGKFAEK
jgi:hypothetical protein